MKFAKFLLNRILNKGFRIEKKFIYMILAILLIASFPLYANKKVQAQEQTYTNQLTKTINLTVERLSDVEVIVIPPLLIGEGRGEVLTTRADNNGKVNIDIPLGTQKDNPSTCHPVLVEGCQDGEYTIKITSIDAAGNRSETTEVKIIRDTIAPNKPEVGEAYICGSNICIDLTGEAGTEVLVNNQPTGVIMTSSNVTLSLVEGYQSNTTYNFTISLKDKATNVSESVSRSITTQPGRGAGGTGNEKDVFGASTSAKYNSIYDMEIEVNEQTGEYKILKFDLPAPELTFVSTSYPNGEVNVYGVGLNKNQNLNVNARVKIFGKSFQSVKEICGEFHEAYDLIIKKRENCIMEHTKLTQEQIYREIDYAGENCNKDYLVLWKKLNTKCFYKESFDYESLQQATVPISNVELLMQKNSIEDISEQRTCDIGQPCFNESKRYWNDTEDGRFQLQYPNTILKENDKLNAKHRIFTKFNLNVNYKDYQIDLNGVESGWSNEVVVDPTPTFLQSAVHPLAYDESCKEADRVWSGPEGDDDFGDRANRYPYHIGVDIRAVNNEAPCKINSVAGGKVKKTFEDLQRANIIDIEHDEVYTTRYIHGWDYLVAKDQILNKGDFIFTMGCTGDCDGRHLHFELYENGAVVDPQLEHYFGYMGGEGNFYVRTKRY